MNRRAQFKHYSPPLLFLLFFCPACSSATDSAPQVVIHPRNGDLIHVSVEVVDTQEKRQLGLMYRHELAEFSGMLFIFERELPLNFWMKNTPLPLDIIYINAELRVVHIAENTTPYSTAQIPSKYPAKYVLEVNGGFCQQRAIAPGSRIELRNVSSPLL